jgi:hypothetical protein
MSQGHRLSMDLKRASERDASASDRWRAGTCVGAKPPGTVRSGNDRRRMPVEHGRRAGRVITERKRSSGL